VEIFVALLSILIIGQTGVDTDTVNKVEARIRARYSHGLPPHLLPSAKDVSYTPGSDQSRVFVASQSEFSTLPASVVQNILRERLILVHGNTFDQNYRWDLESFGRLYDVDKNVTVQGEIGDRSICVNNFNKDCISVATLVHAQDAAVRHHQGTLREFHNLTSSFPIEDCPPLNAISLPSFRRNLHVPCQFGSMASHEVAQTRVPSEYSTVFNVPDTKPHTEWSLIGGQGAISPFHIDSEGLATVVVVLEGSKHWAFATRIGDNENICSADSLGPHWDPYFVNMGDNVDRFQFEAVHLQKGDML
jgi:hypothetical protein